MQVSETYKSKSGLFFHTGGIVSSFIPNSENAISGGIDLPGAWCDGIRHYENAVKSLIVPDGVKGFADEFFRGWAVTIVR